MLARMTMTTRIGRVALSALLVAGFAACKKDKKEDGAAKGTGTAVGTGTGTAAGSGTGTGAKVEGGQAMSAIKGAIAMADGKDAPSAGGLGGMGAALGGLFGGGRPSAAIAPMGEDKAGNPDQPPPTTIVEGDEQPPTEPTTPDFADVKFPAAGKAGGGCPEVADRIDSIIRAVFTSQIGQLDAETRKMVEAEVEAEIGKVKTQMLEMCTSQSWTQPLKDCLLVAMDMNAVQACEQHMTEAQKNAPAPDDKPSEPAKPVPAWTGGDDCNAVGERITQLAIGQVDLDPDQQKEMMETMKDATGEIVTACTAGSWSAEVRGCFFKAASINDAEGCFQNAGL